MARIMKPEKIFCIFWLTLILITNLTGCATTEQNVRWAKMDNPFPQNLNNFPDNITTDELDKVQSLEELERHGDLNFTQGNLYMAYIHYEKFLKIDPDNIGILYKKGQLFLAGKLSDDAVTAFNTVLEKDGEHSQAYEGKGKALFQTKKYETAEINFLKAVELDPALWQSYNFLGVIYDYRKEYDKAIEKYRRAISIKPDNEIIYNNLGVSYSLSGQYDNAVKAFREALTYSSDSKDKTYNNLGLVLSRLGQDNEAFKAFRHSGDSVSAYNNLGCVYLEKGDYDKAIDYFEEAVNISPLCNTLVLENLKKARLLKERAD